VSIATTTSTVDHTLIAVNNVAQNSWKAHWFVSPFDPTVDGTYDFYLTASDGTGEIAKTEMQVIVGDGAAAVPEPASMIIWGLLGTVCAVGALRRRRRSA
jgi:hypothetical protein